MGVREQGNGAGLSGAALFIPESKQTGSVRVQLDFFSALFYSVWAPSLFGLVPPISRNESFPCGKFVLHRHSELCLAKLLGNAEVAG